MVCCWMWILFVFGMLILILIYFIMFGLFGWLYWIVFGIVLFFGWKFRESWLFDDGVYDCCVLVNFLFVMGKY